jgi:hypothetical protein
MKVLVTVKRVPDPETKFKVDPGGKWIQTQGVKFAVNPFDEIAIEEDLRMKEKHQAEVVLVSIGVTDRSSTSLRAGVAGRRLAPGGAHGANRARGYRPEIDHSPEDLECRRRREGYSGGRLLFWDTDGFWVLSKRLQAGRFRKLSADTGSASVVVTAAELGELLRAVRNPTGGKKILH